MLNIQNLTLHYGAAQALKSVSLQAKLGEVTAVLGRNGVGKTSLMRAITGRHPTSGGSIEWQGKNIAIILVEQYFEFARDLCGNYAVMDRGEVVLEGRRQDMIEDDVRRWLTV